MIGLNEIFGTTERPAPLPPCNAFFGPNGVLATALNLEQRPQQSAMADAVRKAFATKNALLVEAGTGVGKSLAYLLPALLEAIPDGRKVIVSTHTIALQNQLLNKDVPLLRSIFHKHPQTRPFADFSCALLVGKANYLCGRRLQTAVKEASGLLLDPLNNDLQIIAKWAAQSKSGKFEDLPHSVAPEAWDLVNADSPSCNAKSCSPDSCPYRRARKAVEDSQLLIINHALLFSLLGAGHFPTNPKTPGILFPDDSIILDEAHTIPAIAADHLGLSLSQIGLRRELLKVYNPRHPKRQTLCQKLFNPSVIADHNQLLDEVDRFFDAIRGKFLSKATFTRLTIPEWIPNAIDAPLADLLQHLRNVESRVTDEYAKSELQGLRAKIQAHRDGISQAISLADDAAVYWTERSGTRFPNVHLRSAPLDVAEALRPHFFAGKAPAVLTSATLAVADSMAPFANRVGATEAAANLILSSPFDFDLQMRVCIAEDAPASTNTREAHALNIPFLVDSIAFLSQRLPGGTLVLFTAFRDLKAVADALPNHPNFDRPVLQQARGVNRTQLVSQMQALGNAVLLGTDSFWAGIDIPGPALSHVIITRLPFQNPSDPLQEAIAERCARQNQSFFQLFALPAALVQFRQGIGRLIRSQFDSGLLSILDSRILTKSYGRLFLQSLPTRDFVRFNQRNRHLRIPNNC